MATAKANTPTRISSWLRHPYVVTGSILLLVLASVFVCGLPWVVDHLIKPLDVFTARAFSITLKCLGMQGQSIGNLVMFRIFGKPFSLSIAYGCDGALALLILYSGIIPFPVSAWRRIVGLLVGVVYVFVVNQVRLVGLALILLAGPTHEEFEFWHIYAGQLFGILMVFFYWSKWLSWSQPPPAVQLQPETEVARGDS